VWRVRLWRCAMLTPVKLLILPGVLRDTSFRLPYASCAWRTNTVNTARGIRAPPTPVQARGASLPTECMCKPGNYRDRSATALHAVCTECSRPFFCANSLGHSCHQNKSINENRASSKSSCRCWPGFFETAVSMGDHNATRRTCQEMVLYERVLII